ncbi:MAG TPA: tyrosine-type recombinase/integrase [Planctomycetota bacterium]|jgi:integrase
MKIAPRFRSVLGPSITRYLTLKRALGRQYANEERVLQSIDQFVRLSAPANLTAATFASWGGTLQHLTPTVLRNRMRIARNFCLFKRRSEPECFVPDPLLFPSSHQARRPYVFTKGEIVHILAAAQQMEPTNGSPLRPEVYRLAIILLYTTGLRRGELTRMTLGDYDAKQRTLFVSRTKFHKSRYVPLSDDGVHEVERYLQTRRAHHLSVSSEVPLMWNRYTGRHCFTAAGLAQGIRELLRKTGVRTPDHRLPRVHDFRHTFAVHALLRWYEAGADVQAKLPLLATYMGHVSIVSTEYYLHFIEPLASAASARFGLRCGALVSASAKRGGSRQ